MRYFLRYILKPKRTNRRRLSPTCCISCAWLISYISKKNFLSILYSYIFQVICIYMIYIHMITSNAPITDVPPRLAAYQAHVGVVQRQGVVTPFCAALGVELHPQGFGPWGGTHVSIQIQIFIIEIILNTIAISLQQTKKFLLQIQKK